MSTRFRTRNSFSLKDFRVFFLFWAGTSCAVFTTRPVQEMSNTSASIRAAKEVQADTLAPELYRQSREWFFKAQQEYKLKNFKNAKEYADTARHYAEEAELEALKNNGIRNSEANIPDPMSDSASAPGGNLPVPPPPTPPKAEPYDFPSPTPTPFDQYEKRRAEEEAAKKAEEQKRSITNPATDIYAPPQPLISPNPNNPDSSFRYQNLPQ